VLKNFPTQAQIRSLLQDKAVNIEFKQLEYFWHLLYNKQEYGLYRTLAKK
jgi:DNA-dependent RNA polymerase auxiliary subunit epsilon